jgi:hypothetical protein
MSKGNAIPKISGVHISILDGQNELLSWDEPIEIKLLHPGAPVIFSTTPRSVPQDISDIIVKVSVF